MHVSVNEANGISTLSVEPGSTAAEDGEQEF